MAQRLSSLTVALALALLLRSGLAQAAPPAALACPPGGTTLRWEGFAEPFLTEHCGLCHAWNHYTSVWFYKDQILGQVEVGNMPPFEPLSREAVAMLAEWISCDLPVDGVCPAEGSDVTYDNFAAEFLDVNCSSCHSKSVEGEDRRGAPIDQNWDDPASLRSHAPRIRDTVLRNQMPPQFGLSPSPEADKLVEWIACGLQGLPEKLSYRRGDANADGTRDITDAVRVLVVLFEGIGTLPCADAADMDGSGSLDVTDAIYWLRFLFLGGPAPPEPFRDCGNLSRLGCEQFSGC